MLISFVECVVWGTIPREAVICHFALSDLLAFLSTNHSCGEILDLDAFEPDRSTLQVSSVLRAKNTTLNIVTARAIGQITKTFLGREGVDIHHIKEFIARLVDGWGINSLITHDIHMQRLISRAFAEAFGSDYHLLQALMGAFEDGIQEGTQALAFYARRQRPGPRHVRT